MSLYKDASLVMIPSAYKDGRLYSIRPVEELGDELVTNGSFDTNSDWSLGSGSTISGGSLNIVSAPYNANTKQTISLTNGTTYKISIDYTASGSATSNTFQLGFGDSSGDPTDTTQHEFEEGSGVKTLNVTAASGDATIIFRSRDAGTCDLSINSVSVKEVITANGDFDFSRGSNLAATRVDVNGLIEKGRENLLTYSNDFSNAAWTKNVAVTSGQLGYDGTNNAWEINKGTGSPYRYVRTPVSTSGVQSASIYAKAGTLNLLGIYIDGGSAPYIAVDLSNGTLIGQRNTEIDTNIESVGNGWYRISMAFNENSTQYYIYPDWNQSNTGTLYIQDAQLEAGLVATDYIETGASTAQAGILEDMPRLDYSGSCPALLLEPQRTNAIGNSEYFGVWENTESSTLTPNNTESPEGVDNAYEHTPTTTNAYHRISNNFSTTSGTTYTASLFVKANGYDYFLFRIGSISGVYHNASFDLSDGSVDYLSSSLDSSAVEDYGNGWYRLKVTFTADQSSTTIGIRPQPTSITSNSIAMYQGDGTSGSYIFGAQAEVGSYPTSYIPTYGSSVTRSYDNPFLTNVSSLIGQTQGSVLVELTRDALESYTQRVVSLSDGTSNNTIGLQLTSANSFSYYVTKDGVLQGLITKTDATTANQKVKVAFAYAENDFVMYVDGVLAGSDTSGSIPAVNTIKFQRESNGLHYVGLINQLSVFPTRLTNAELAALTTI